MGLARAHKAFAEFEYFLYLVSVVLLILAAGYFYRAAFLTLEGATHVLPSWEEPWQYFQSGLKAVAILACVFSPSIILLTSGLLMMSAGDLFWATFVFIAASFFFAFSLAISPVVWFRMIESGEYRWALNLYGVLEDIGAMKLDYGRTFVALFLIYFLIQMMLLVFGAILSLTPLGMFLSASMVGLVLMFFFSSIVVLLLKETGALFTALPYQYKQRP